MTNEQLAIYLQNIETRLRLEIENLESELPAELRRKPEPLPKHHPLASLQNLGAEYFPCLASIKSFANELECQISLLLGKNPT